MESSSNHMACLLKIESHTWGWDKSLENLLSTIDVNYMIDEGSRTVYAYGNVDPQRILEKITKAGKRAKMIWSNNGRRRNREDHFREQCCSSEYVNAPNGFLDYHQQQCYYPQPRRMMNLYQPYYQQTCALPPPYYTPQLHHQPPPPPVYMFHQNEPVAVFFPPTPAPREDFTLGCMIM